MDAEDAWHRHWRSDSRGENEARLHRQISTGRDEASRAFAGEARRMVARAYHLFRRAALARMGVYAPREPFDPSSRAACGLFATSANVLAVRGGADGRYGRQGDLKVLMSHRAPSFG